MNFETRIAREDGSLAYLEDAERAEKRRKFVWIAAAIVLALMALGVAWYMFSAKKEAAAEAAAADGKKDGKGAPNVTVVVPGRQLVENYVNATGTLAARREMPVGAVGEGGMVTRVLVEAGTWVRAGQVLATVDRQVQTQQSAQIVGQISAAEAEARLAQSELERALALQGRGFISKADVQRKTATRDGALARVRIARAQLGENRARIGRLDVRAPASGLVLTRAVEPGQVVGAGGAVLFRIALGGELEMRAKLSEADLALMRTGQIASVTPVGTTTAFTGPIRLISPVIDPETRQGEARIALRYNAALRPGGFASARITSGKIEAPLLPESAVLSDPKGNNFVFLVDDGNKAVRRVVKVGSVTDRGVTVVEGLAGNERVVASAGGFLNEGETVKPHMANAAK